MTNKPRAGDRVRITLEGEVVEQLASGEAPGALKVIIDAPGGMAEVTRFTPEEQGAKSFRAVVIQPAIRVGDEVIGGYGLASFRGPVEAIARGHVWIGDSEDTGVIRKLADCRRVDRGEAVSAYYDKASTQANQEPSAPEPGKALQWSPEAQLRIDREAKFVALSQRDALAQALRNARDHLASLGLVKTVGEIEATLIRSGCTL